VVMLVPLLGCGGEDKPVDVNGVYTLNVTNSSNECMVVPWMEGNQASGVATLTLTQQTDDPDKVRGVVKGIGLPGVAIDIALKWAYDSNEFSGRVSGKEVSMTNVGSGRTTMVGATMACTATTTAEVVAVIDKDTITGNIFYQFKTNQSPECEYRNNCKTTQNFNGARPPR